jgi:HSP20 family protein
MLPIVRKNQESWLPDIFNDFFDNSWMERANYTAPAINVIENEKEYEVELAAPGLTKEDFQVHVDENDNLVINMEKKAENHDKKQHGRYLRREFSYEKFQQMLTLPENVEADKIEAKVEHGVLNVHIPKKNPVEVQKAVKQIEIK